MKNVITIGAISTESYRVDSTVYIHSPMIGWQKMSPRSRQRRPAIHEYRRHFEISEGQLLAGSDRGRHCRWCLSSGIAIAGLTSTLLATGPATAAGLAEANDELHFRLFDVADANLR